MKIKLATARDLFVAIGYQTAVNWTAEQMLKKLNKIDQVTKADDPNCDLIDARLDKARLVALQTVADKGTFEITEVEAADAPAPAEGMTAAENTAAPVAEAPAEVAAEDTPPNDETDTPAKPAKKPGGGVTKTKPAKAKAVKPAKEPKDAKAPKEPKAVKVKKATAPELAGQLFKKHGLAVGVTEKLVNEFNKAYGRENPYRTWYDLKAAWGVVRGFTDDKEVTEAPGVRASETRPTVAGRILADKGDGFKLDETTVALLDKNYGVANPKESETMLRFAQGVVRGYAAV